MGLAPLEGMRKNLAVCLLFGAVGCGAPDPFDIWGQSADPGTYRLTDSGIRCVTTPCPSLLATPADSGEPVTVSDIDFPSSMSLEERHAVLNRVFTPAGLVVRGAVHGDAENAVFELES